MAEPTLAKMEPQEDLSDSNADLHESLSRLSASNKDNETERIHDWINNSSSETEANLLHSKDVQPTLPQAGSTGTFQEVTSENHVQLPPPPHFVPLNETLDFSNSNQQPSLTSEHSITSKTTDSHTSNAHTTE